MIEEEILKLLRKYGRLTRDQIAKITDLPRTTIHNKLTKLLQKRKVKKRTEKTSRRGRPKIIRKQPKPSMSVKPKTRFPTLP